MPLDTASADAYVDDRSQPPPHQRFATLDDYLAHLRRLGAQDYPFYDEVAPGLYRLNTGRGAAARPPPPTVTRDQLLRRHGFTR